MPTAFSLLATGLVQSPAQSVNLQPQPMIAASAQQLSDLMHGRQQLVEIQVAEKNRLSRASKIVQADIEDHLKQLEHRIESLNQQIQTLGQQQADWQRKDQILQSVKGIGAVTAALCLVELPELASSMKNRSLAWLELPPSITTVVNTRANG